MLPLVSLNPNLFDMHQFVSSPTCPHNWCANLIDILFVIFSTRFLLTLVKDLSFSFLLDYPQYKLPSVVFSKMLNTSCNTSVLMRFNVFLSSLIVHPSFRIFDRLNRLFFAYGTNLTFLITISLNTLILLLHLLTCTFPTYFQPCQHHLHWWHYLLPFNFFSI